MQSEQQILIGTLIGLARATEGNEDLITNNTNKILINSLCSLNKTSVYYNQKTNEYIKEIENEKRRLIPGCYSCQSVCGKNENYNFTNLTLMHNNIADLKKVLLSKLVDLASIIYENDLYNKINYSIYTLIFKGLFFIGMDDINENYITSLSTDIDQTISSLKSN